MGDQKHSKKAHKKVAVHDSDESSVDSSDEGPRTRSAVADEFEEVEAEKVDEDESEELLQDYIMPSGFVAPDYSKPLLDHSVAANKANELWLIQVPANVDLSKLGDHSVKFSKPDPTTGKVASIKLDDAPYWFVEKAKEEYSSLVNVLPSKEDGRLKLGKPFSRYYQMVQPLEDAAQQPRPFPAWVAPGQMSLSLRYAPPGSDKVNIRPAREVPAHLLNAFGPKKAKLQKDGVRFDHTATKSPAKASSTPSRKKKTPVQTETVEEESPMEVDQQVSESPAKKSSKKSESPRKSSNKKDDKKDKKEKKKEKKEKKRHHDDEDSAKSEQKSSKKKRKVQKEESSDDD